MIIRLRYNLFITNFLKQRLVMKNFPTSITISRFLFAIVVSFLLFINSDIATILAVIFLEEIPSIYWYLGASLILVGIYLALSGFDEDFIDSDSLINHEKMI